jgi:hypothetical protein
MLDLIFSCCLGGVDGEGRYCILSCEGNSDAYLTREGGEMEKITRETVHCITIANLYCRGLTKVLTHAFLA